MPAPMIADVAAPASSVEANPASSVRHVLRQPDQPHGDGGDDAERALGADDRAEQVVAGRVGRGAAELDHVAVRA